MRSIQTMLLAMLALLVLSAVPAIANRERCDTHANIPVTPAPTTPARPTPAPTTPARPTPAPTTQAPTTLAPTQAPSQAPTQAPSQAPTQAPTQSPTPCPKKDPVINNEVSGDADRAVNLPAVATDAAPGGLGNDEQQVMLSLINQLRAQHNRPPLVLEARLMQSAQAHADDQAANCQMSHTGSNGSSPGDRAKGQGFSSDMIWENVAAGQDTVESVMDSWISSEGHFENLVNSPATQVGFAKATNSGCLNYNVYWTQVFGLP